MPLLRLVCALDVAKWTQKFAQIDSDKMQWKRWMENWDARKWATAMSPADPQLAGLVLWTVPRRRGESWVMCLLVWVGHHLPHSETPRAPPPAFTSAQNAKHMGAKYNEVQVPLRAQELQNMTLSEGEGMCFQFFSIMVPVGQILELGCLPRVTINIVWMNSLYIIRAFALGWTGNTQTRWHSDWLASTVASQQESPMLNSSGRLLLRLFPFWR